MFDDFQRMIFLQAGVQRTSQTSARGSGFISQLPQDFCDHEEQLIAGIDLPIFPRPIFMKKLFAIFFVCVSQATNLQLLRYSSRLLRAYSLLFCL